MTIIKNINRHRKFAFIYGLKNKFNGDILYVGRAVNPVQRYKAHLYGRDTSWQRKKLLRLSGDCRPILYLFEMLDNIKEKVLERERYWIKFCVEKGYPLMNRMYYQN